MSHRSTRPPRNLFALTLVLALLLSTWPGFGPIAQAASPDLVISQVYGAGGNTGAVRTHDYVELFNRSNSTISLTGKSIQYASATGTGNFGANPVVSLSGTLAPGQYLLVQLAGGSVGTPLPTPDATGTINLSGTTGKVALVNSTTGLACNGGSTPCSAAQLALIIDLVGYGTANFFEGAGPAPAASTTLALFRAAGGCTDTDNNNADFSTGEPAPRNRSSTLAPCTNATPPSGSGSAAPASLAAGEAVTLTVEAVPGTGPASPIVTVTADLTPIGGSAAADLYNNGTHGDAVAGDTIWTLLTTVSTTTAPGAKSLPVTITDGEGRTASAQISLTVAAPPVKIHQIQGASHTSPLVDQFVSGVMGIVTARRGNGFYMQDPDPDNDPATSDAIFIFTSSAPAVQVGDRVKVSGTVSEYRPGATGLALTQITGPTVQILATGQPLPPPVVIGVDRTVPSTVIDDDSTGFVETTGLFDPHSDGIDFWESLEAMLVALPNPEAVGPTNRFGEIPVVVAGASVRPPRGGIVVQQHDFNPERIFLDDTLRATVNVQTGDRFDGLVVGVIDYSFNNFKLNIIEELPPVIYANHQAAPATAAGPGELAIATYNVLNLDPGDGPAQFAAIAHQIVNYLQSPDIVAVQEVQDNNGPTNNGVVDASLTYTTLISAIQAAGGPTYEFRDIAPVNNQDGGEPGGNIRVGFLYRTDRGLAFVDRPGGTATAATSVVSTGSGPALSHSPGRIDPTNGAFASSRKPLVAEFTFRGQTLFVINNHLNSKGGDQPLWGRTQPPVLSSEVQRIQQAQIINSFVQAILAVDPAANIVVLGDLNDFPFSAPLAALKGSQLHNLIEDLPVAQRYTYIFEGNSQVLDHILVSQNVYAMEWSHAILHLNADFLNYTSDHDPQVVRIRFNRAPVADAGGPYTVTEGDAVTLTASGTDPDFDSLTYDWDLDGDGSFESPGQTVTFAAALLSGPATRTVTVRVTDSFGVTATAQATVTITPVTATTGSVTGGGVIDSPAGAFTPDPSLAAQATLNLLLQYKKGEVTPSGTFRFEVGDGLLRFEATAFHWLTVSGSTARLRGTGAFVDDGATYTFIVTVIDSPQKQADQFRLQVWAADGSLVYDNQTGTDLPALKAGSLTVWDR